MPHKHIDMAAQMRRAKALELRIQGKTWDEIADDVGYPNRTAAFKAAQLMLNQHVIADVEEYRKLEDLRLDRLLSSIWKYCVGYTETKVDEETGEKKETHHCPDGFMLDRAIRIAERRAKLLGLDVKNGEEFSPSMVLIREIAAPVGDV